MLYCYRYGEAPSPVVLHHNEVSMSNGEGILLSVSSLRAR